MRADHTYLTYHTVALNSLITFITLWHSLEEAFTRLGLTSGPSLPFTPSPRQVALSSAL
jgi:hypothetical protein